MANRLLSVIVATRLTELEMARLRAAARADGVTVSQYIRRLVIAARPDHA